MSKTILLLDEIHPLLGDILSEHGFTIKQGFTISKPETCIGIVVRSKVVNKALINHFKGLKFIARAGSGTENIDVTYAKTKGIVVLNSPEANRIAVAEHALGMLLALLNRIVIATHEVKQGRWERKANWGQSLYGKTIGIIGYGHTGSAFAHVLKGLGVRILAYDKYKHNYGDLQVEETSLEQVMKQSHIVTLHLPQTSETKGYANASFFKAMRPNGIFINTSRGSLVDHEALLKSLTTKHLSGVCLDVLDIESSNFEKAAQNKTIKALLSLPNVIVTPHIAGWTHESYRLHSEVLARKIVALKI